MPKSCSRIAGGVLVIATAGSAARGRRPHPEQLAVDRGDARLHRVRAREMGCAGQAARSRARNRAPGDEIAVNAAQARPPRRDKTQLLVSNQPSVTGGLCKLLQECRKTFREGLFF